MTLRSENGWLAPGGAFYPCALTEHQKTIHELISSTPDEAFELGWLVLEDGKWAAKHPDRAVTFVQYGVLKDWHLAHGKVMPEWIRRA